MIPEMEIKEMTFKIMIKIATTGAMVGMIIRPEGMAVEEMNDIIYLTYFI